MLLDHLAVICADLDAGCAWVEARLGVRMQAGGQHGHYATHNRLLGLAEGIYLEVIAPDPNATCDRPRWFGLDDAPQQPRLGNWICQAEQLDRFRGIAGPAVALQRGDLHWQITVPTDGTLPLEGGFPTLIKWGHGVPHPATVLADSGLRLIDLRIQTPDADRVHNLCQDLDPRVTLAKGAEVVMQAEFETTTGKRVML